MRRLVARVPLKVRASTADEAPVPGSFANSPAHLAVRRLVLTLLALVAALWTLPPSEAEAAASGTLVVRFSAGSTAAERAEALTDAGLAEIEPVAGTDFVVAEDEPGAAPAPLEARAVIVDARPPVRMQATALPPNDPGFPYQWHLAAVQVPAVWDLTRGAGVTVAVLDTGVAYENAGPHLLAPDLAATRFVPGFDFVDGDDHPNDENGHGTHVTGTIAQSTGNGIGVAGVAPDVSIMPLRVLDAVGGGSDVAAAAALRWAADHGAHVANLSFGGPTGSPLLSDAVAYATGMGVTIVAAAGNAGTGAITYPAAERNVIAVGAVRFDRTRASYSNVGPALDIVGPGGDLSVDQNLDSYRDGVLQQAIGADGQFCYCFLQGTSMASPHVAAVAALVVSRGVAAPAAVLAVLQASALDLGQPGRDDLYGAGMVQALDAVEAADERSDPSAAPAPPDSGSGPLTLEAACPSDRTPDAAFTDMAAGDTHRHAVDCMAWWGIAAGTSPTTYSPTAPVTRAQMASFVARAVEAAGRSFPEPTADSFDDDNGSVHERRINQLAAAGIVAGAGARSFSPGVAVTRAQMATFLVRAHDYVDATPLPYGLDYFSDDQGDVHETAIDTAAAAGIAAGTSPGLFSPAVPVTRAQVASFLARTLELLVRDGTATAR